MSRTRAKAGAGWASVAARGWGAVFVLHERCLAGEAPLTRHVCLSVLRASSGRVAGGTIALVLRRLARGQSRLWRFTSVRFGRLRITCRSSGTAYGSPLN